MTNGTVDILVPYERRRFGDAGRHRKITIFAKKIITTIQSTKIDIFPSF
jgi:hypothetical protein